MTLVQSRPGRIKIAQEACEQIDLCAGAVLNALTLAAVRKLRERRISISGNMPKTSEAAEIVAATGLPKELGVQLPVEFTHFKNHGLVHGWFTGDKATRSSRGDIEVTRLIDYLNDCLRGYGFEFSEEGNDRIGELVAEVINNCEDHSGRHEWWISAYLRQPSGKEYGDCHITVFNLGASLAETLQKLPADSVLRRDIDRLMQHHEDRGHFRSGVFTREAAWTICALQPRVSCYNTGPYSVQDRGQGTVKMMEAFHRLGQVRKMRERPAMALVSGRTHIRFDNTYTLKLLPIVGADTKEIIAFNPENDLNLPPDRKYVSTLKNSFPGTILSLRFFIDPGHLETVPDYASKTH